MTRGVRRRRGPTQPRLHRGECRRAGALCRALPGGRPGPDRRARSADGRRAHDGTLWRGHRRGSPSAVQQPLHTARDPGGGRPETQHGPGASAAEQPTPHEVADATLTCLLRAVPAAVPAIALLSGGQTGELASARLNAVILASRSRAPWVLGFSFARAIQQPALEIWHGEDANIEAAQHALRHRATCDQMARRGEYSATVERTVGP